MNIRLSQCVRWTGRTAYAMVQHGARLTHRFILSVGCTVTFIALVLWLSPAWRTTLTAQIRTFFNATAPPDFRRLLADESNSNHLFDTLNNRSQTLALQVKNLPNISSEAPAFLSFTKKLALQPEAQLEMADLRKQARIADYIARRYRVARVPVGNLVKAAFSTGREFGLDPLLLLAVMAVESRFNPYAESVVGAQGLMQVMSKVHLNKFEYFGGPDATLDPLVNLKVGALILQEYIARGGSLTEGLRLYVGALPSSASGYAVKVLAERKLLRDVARGLNVSIYAGRKSGVHATQNQKKGLDAYAISIEPEVAQDSHEPTLLNASN